MFDEIPKESDSSVYYQKLSKIDSLLLSKGEKLLDSLNWKNYIRTKGAKAFVVEVNQ